MTMRIVPPTRRSTSAVGVSQPGMPWSQRRSTSSLVQASKTRSTGASKVRSIRKTRATMLGHLCSSRYSPTTSKSRSQRVR